MRTSKSLGRNTPAEIIARNGGVLPALAGGADSPIPYPLDPVTVSGTEITLDQYVNYPTVITRAIALYAGQRMYANRVFTVGGDVQGGAILFERPNPLLTDLYAARRVQEVAPGGEAPILTFARGVPMVAKPRKIMGKFSVLKEERKRNNPQIVINAIVQAANTLDLGVQTMAMGELNAVIAATSRTFAAGQTWTSATTTTLTTTTKANQPLADLVNVAAFIDNEERGIRLNGAILNPLDWANLVKVYGADGVGPMLESVGITEFFVTPRQTQGRVKLYQAGMVGEWRNEFPLDQLTWEDEETDRTWWYQWSISPAFAVTNQYAILEITGV
jgi:hypothetical protein